MPIGTNSIDRIISNCVINLVPDKQKAFSEMFRVLKSGGAFVISDVVSQGAIPEEIKHDAALWAGCVAGALDKEEELSIVRAAGFQKIEILREKKYQEFSTSAYGLFSITLKGVK